jgi:2-phosphoglycerate kinase
LTLAGVVWIGGSTCAGKTSVARRVADRYTATLYSRDEREPKQIDAVDAERYPKYARWATLTLDERWARSSVDELVADTLALGPEVLEMTLKDIEREPKPVVVEGFQIYPDLLASHLPTARHAVFLVAAPDFRRRTHFARPHAWHTPSRTSDPERAQANRLARDERIGEEIHLRATAAGLKVIDVDGARGVDDVAEEVQAWLEPALR